MRKEGKYTLFETLSRSNGNPTENEESRFLFFETDSELTRGSCSPDRINSA